MIRIIALDPGGTTGWATATYEPLDDGVASLIWSGGQLGPEEHHSDLYALLEMQQPEGIYAVVCESFEFRQGAQRANLNLMSKEYIGVTKLFCSERNVGLKMQTAAMAKGFVSDEKIKKVDLWRPGLPHYNDAMRHLLYFVANNTEGSTRRALLEAWK